MTNPKNASKITLKIHLSKLSMTAPDIGDGSDGDRRTSDPNSSSDVAISLGVTVCPLTSWSPRCRNRQRQ